MTAPASAGDRTARRIVVALSISTFSQWGGASAVLPLLPVYLKREGSPDSLIGLTMAAFFAAAVLVQYPLGRLSDRIGRRGVQIGGLVTYGVATFLFAAVSAPLAALLFRALQGAGAGVVDVANAATLGEVVPSNQRGRAFGALYGARTAGMAAGPLLGSLLGLAGMRLMFLAAGGAALVAILPIVVAVPVGVGRTEVRREERVPLWQNRSILGVAASFLAGGVLIGMYEACWSLLLSARGARPWQVGLSWTLFALPFAILSLPAGRLAEKLDRRWLTAFSLIGSAAFAVAYPLIHSVAWLVGLGAAEAALVVIGIPAESSQLSHSVHGHELGRAQGAVSTAQTAAMAVAAAMAGALFSASAGLPFFIAAGAIVASVGAMGYFWRGVPGKGSALPARVSVRDGAVAAETDGYAPAMAVAETPLGLIAPPASSREGGHSSAR